MIGNVATEVISHDFQRRIVFNAARRKADQLGLKLLNYGSGMSYKYIYENSDINADIVPRDIPNFMQVPLNGFLRIPLPDKSCVVYSAHTLEHVEHPEGLMEEFRRISDHIYVITPSPLFLAAWLVPEHRWVYIGGRKVSNPLHKIAQIYREPYRVLFRGA